MVRAIIRLLEQLSVRSPAIIPQNCPRIRKTQLHTIYIPKQLSKTNKIQEELYQDDCPVGRSKLIYMNRSKDLNSFNLHFVSRLRSLFEVTI